MSHASTKNPSLILLFSLCLVVLVTHFIERLETVLESFSLWIRLTGISKRIEGFSNEERCFQLFVCQSNLVTKAIDGFKWLGKMMLSIKRKKKSLFYFRFLAFSDSNSVIVLERDKNVLSRK